MKFMVEFQLQPDTKDKAVEAFELRGPNRNPGVKFLGAWIAAHSNRVFVLCESAEQALVERAGAAWSEVGTPTIHAVIDVEEY